MNERYRSRGSKKKEIASSLREDFGNVFREMDAGRIKNDLEKSTHTGSKIAIKDYKDNSLYIQTEAILCT